jgi:tRNA dimethylallyltransferase
MQKTPKTLLVLAGPTAVGKTTTAIKLAQHYQCPILSFDSRQFYMGMKIGTAAPTEDELKAAEHFFIGHLNLEDYYNVSMFEQEALALLQNLFTKHDIVITTGGSGLYIQALCEGIDDLPDADKSLRAKLQSDLEKKGITWLQKEVQNIDPEYYSIVDTQNPKRLLRALEVFLATGKTYTSQRTAEKKERPFHIIKLALNLPRPELFSRINLRVENMIEKGLVDEAKSLLPKRELNSLNTVGYKEIFTFLDGDYTLEEAKEKIKTNTRRYAKRQITWFKKDLEYTWFEPQNIEEMVDYIKKCRKEE